MAFYPWALWRRNGRRSRSSLALPPIAALPVRVLRFLIVGPTQNSCTTMVTHPAVHVIASSVYSRLRSSFRRHRMRMVELFVYRCQRFRKVSPHAHCRYSVKDRPGELPKSLAWAHLVKVFFSSFPLWLLGLRSKEMRHVTIVGDPASPMAHGQHFPRVPLAYVI
jgi:hypothetical protein